MAKTKAPMCWPSAVQLNEALIKHTGYGKWDRLRVCQGRRHWGRCHISAYVKTVNAPAVWVCPSCEEAS